VFSKKAVMTIALGQLLFAQNLWAFSNPLDWFRSVIEKKQGMTTYEKLPCANQKEYDHYKDYLTILDKDLPGKLCGDGSKKEKFAKLLKFLDSLKVATPKEWKGGANEALLDPLKYLKSKALLITFDWDTSGGIVAYNFRESIYIGNYLFTLLPLDAVHTLIHEARHSQSGAPKHVRCLTGDRVQQTGACDEWFDTSGKAGAYAYGASYSFGLARFGQPFQISDEDRDFLKKLSLSLLGRRFNALPETLGLPFDVVYTLDSLGNLYSFHPITKELTYIKNDLSEKIDRIEFERRSGGLVLHDVNDGVYNDEDQYGPFKNLFDDIATFPDHVKQYVTLTGGDSSDAHLLTNDGRIWKKSLDFKTLKFGFDETPFHAQEDLKKLIHARSNVRFALAESGKLYHFSNDVKGEVDGELVADRFQDPLKKGWDDLYGGLWHTEVMGINKDREIYREILTADGKALIKKIPLSIGSTTKIANYEEGVNIRIARQSPVSSVYIQRYDDLKNGWIELRLNEVSSSNDRISYFTDVAITRKFKPSSRFVDARVNQDFIKECELKKWDLDPWSGRGVGISKYNELVFEGGPYDFCQIYDNHGIADVSDFRFVGTTINEPGIFSSSSIEILSEGGWKKVIPYENRGPKVVNSARY